MKIAVQISCAFSNRCSITHAR